MDKLKPVLEHKFWIFFTLALIIPVVGWWPSANQKNQKITARTQEIEGSFSQANKDVSKLANSKWTNELTKINQEEEKEYKLAHYYLWSEQAKHRVWPDKYLSERFEGVQEMTPEIAAKIDSDSALFYRSNYKQNYVKSLYDSLNPYIVRRTKSDTLKEEGIVAIANKERTFPIFDDSDWDYRAPSIQTVWEAQENLWLLKSLVDAINSMNAGSQVITEAPIKAIYDIDFLGGQGRGVVPEGEEKSEKKYDSYGRLIVDKKNNAGEEKEKQERQDKRFQKLGSDLPLAYNPAEVFGQETTVDSTFRIKQNKKGPKIRFGGDTDAQDDDSSNRRSSRTMGVGDYIKDFPKTAQNQHRFVDNDDNEPFRTRGFHMHLLMDHRKIPQFIEELSKSPWAIRIHRCQFQAEKTQKYFENLLSLESMIVEPPRTNQNVSPKRGFSFGSGDSDNNDEKRANASKVDEQKTKLGYTIALNDPYVAEVYISGKFVIYKKPVQIPEEITNQEKQVAETDQGIPENSEEKTDSDQPEGSSDAPDNNQEQTEPSPEKARTEEKETVTLLNETNSQ